MRTTSPAALLGLSLLTLFVGGVADAVVFTVTKTADTSDGVCDADCSLREAIIAANASPGADEVTIPAGTYTLTIVGPYEFASVTGSVDVTDDLTVEGAGADATIIDGNHTDGVMYVHTGVTAGISGVKIQNGEASFRGGGILNNGSLTVTGSTISGNSAFYGGGGIFNSGSGSLTVTGSTISGNSTSGERSLEGGGGIFNEFGTLSVTNATIASNSAPKGGGIANLYGTATVTGSTVAGNTAGYGAGIFNQTGAQGALTVVNTTISGNTAELRGLCGGFCYSKGGGVFNAGTLDILNTTVSSNTAERGDGIHNEGTLNLISSTVAWNTGRYLGVGVETAESAGTTVVRNTIIAGNLFANCVPTPILHRISSQGHNLDDDGTCGLTGTGDLSDVLNAALGPLQENGGPTLTHALHPASPAIDSGDDVSCPPTDQRGVPRPQGAACDIGAFEAESGVSSTTSSSTSSSSTSSSTSTTTSATSTTTSSASSSSTSLSTSTTTSATSTTTSSTSSSSTSSSTSTTTSASTTTTSSTSASSTSLSTSTTTSATSTTTSSTSSSSTSLSTSTTTSATSSTTTTSTSSTSSTLPRCAALAGIGHLQCLVDELLGSPLCPSGEMPPAFEARLTRRIAKANHLLGQAARASSTRGRNKRLAAAGRVFGDVVRRVGKAARKAGSQTVAPACQTRLDAELGDLQQRISGLRTAPLT